MHMLYDFPFYKLPLYYLNRRFRKATILPSNIVFVVTSKCNSRCKTCFIWKHRENEQKELTLEEYKKIFKSINKAYWVTAGGGEPFLREDFSEILHNICRSLRPRILNIPSNGSQPSEISAIMGKLVKSYPSIQFILNLSLDHIGEKHDEIRGLNGNFESLRRTIDLLDSLKNPNFTAGVHTVLSRYNLEDFPHIYGWIKENLRPKSYIIEDAQVREEYSNETCEFFESKLDYLEALDFYLSKIKSERKKSIDRIRKAFRITYYNSISNALRFNKKPLTCYAGYASCQINPYGEIWACATKKLPMGNLREHDYDFTGLWLSKATNIIREGIGQNRCSCHLSNVSYTNIMLNPAALITTALNYIRY
ncbi:MAG: radical SAM protein [Candidatus Omnitrophota bacterium]